MHIVDAAVRFSAILLLLVIIVLTTRDVVRSTQGLLLNASCLCVIGALLDFTPPYIAWDSPVTLLAGLFSAFDLPAIWLLSLSLFNSRLRVRWPHISLSLCYGLLKYATILQNAEFLSRDITQTYLVVNALALGFMAHIAFRILADRREDLRPDRRRARVVFVCALSAFGAATTLINLMVPGPWLPTMRALTILTAAIVAAFYLLRIDSRALSFKRSLATTHGSLSTRDMSGLERLNRAMRQDAVYRDPDLTITKLATHIELPVYRVRQIILEGLGYDNFKSYLNAQRITAIKRELRDPDMAERTIVEIALRGGFNALSTFNRAFKAEVGQTPSQYRWPGVLGEDSTN